jgi:hypothetical protein
VIFGLLGKPKAPRFCFEKRGVFVGVSFKLSAPKGHFEAHHERK